MTVKLFTNYMGIYISSQKIYENVYWYCRLHYSIYICVLFWLRCLHVFSTLVL